MKKILVMDGGGIRGVFHAKFLEFLEKDLALPIGRYFDLIAGTSTGGIVALGLALEMSAADISKLYETRGPSIFPRRQYPLFSRRFSAFLSQLNLWGPRYDSIPLQQALVDTFGQRRLGEATTRVAIPAWRPKTHQPCVFKTAHHERFRTDWKELVTDIAMATAAAPIFLKEHVTANNVTFLDGGIWANDPTAVAVVEAISVLGWPVEDIKVLSISTVEDVGTLPPALSMFNLFDIKRLFMAGQSLGAMGIASLLCGGPHERGAIFRVAMPNPPNHFALDNADRIHDISGLAYEQARSEVTRLRPVFFAEQAPEFTPVHIE